MEANLKIIIWKALMIVNKIIYFSYCLIKSDKAEETLLTWATENPSKNLCIFSYWVIW